MSPVALGAKRAKLLIGGEWISGTARSELTDRFTGETIAEVEQASSSQVNDAVDAARRSFEAHKLEAYQRFQILQRASLLIEERRIELVETVIAESGFTFSDATAEVNRAAQTLLISAEEAKRIHGEVVPIGGAPGQDHRLAFTIRVPRGVVCAITPFNSPLNTVAHKVAPALAAGNTVVLKPSSYTPLTAAILCEILIEAGLPPGHINLIHGSGADAGRWLAENSGIAFYTFTGSTAVGKFLRGAVGLRPASLELGSISSTIVCEDAPIDRVVPRCVNAAFRKAGQVCTSVQRLYAHESIAGRLLGMMEENVRAAKVGDPRDPRTLVGPMIRVEEAARAETWVLDAIGAGATLVAGGIREGAVLHPTILSGVRPEMKVMCEEIFAPVICIIPYRSFEDAIDQMNNTCYGLAAGVFTADLNRAMFAAKRLHMGSVHINETSSSRVDLMPYSGAKDSGSGREGPKYAIEEMTEERLVTISLGQ
jgi:succinate-semialdehyde dehydrogenase/glutarate-semialdehyde dehydrogenase